MAVLSHARRGVQSVAALGRHVASVLLSPSRLPFRQSHGGTGEGSAHKPRRVALASRSASVLLPRIPRVVPREALTHQMGVYVHVADEHAPQRPAVLVRALGLDFD